jgi:cytosine/adenosine deaminase-related metal-dependent hydrolase
VFAAALADDEDVHAVIVAGRGPSAIVPARRGTIHADMRDNIRLTARYVFPGHRPPIRRGVVVLRDDRVVGVRRRSQRGADFDCGDVAIVPGFVNAHTHLDLSAARGRIPPTGDFIAWLRQVIDFRLGQETSDVERDIREGLNQCVRFGTTLIGDIAHEGLSTDVLAGAPVRSIVFRELIGLTVEGGARAFEGFHWWRAAFPESETCKPGVSPHAPYSVNTTLYHQASASRLPLATHLAETRHEDDLLRRHSGPLVAFLRDVGVWEPSELVPNFAYILKNTRRDCEHALYIHCNYLDPDVPFLPSGSVVYCPRTHAAFGHPPHPFREFIARGVRVALGTDSLASNPDLDLLAEARFVNARYPDVPGATLLRMATLSGAEALGFADVTGSLSPGKSADVTGILTPGKSADFAIVALPPRDASDPHDLLFDSDLPVLATVFRGQRVLVGDEEPEHLPDLPLPTVRVP